MRNRGILWPSLVFAVVMIGACSAIEKEQARSMGDYLQEAGFTVRQATTPAAMTKLKAMPAAKMIKRTKDGAVVYTYADPYDCKCVYVGDQAQYAQYMKIRHAGEMRNAAIETTQMQAAEGQQEADQGDAWWWW